LVRKFGYLLVILIIIVGLIVAALMLQYTSPRSSTTVYVDPPVATCPWMDNFSISVKIRDVDGLYGLQIGFSWDPFLLEYINHTVHIPVEDYPGGVLHEEVLPVEDIVNETAGTYYVAYASWVPAPVFNGNGTIFTISFHVKKMGQCVLRIHDCKLVDKNANEIVCTVENGDFTTGG
jgi:hypothetical protein